MSFLFSCVDDDDHDDHDDHDHNHDHNHDHDHDHDHDDHDDDHDHDDHDESRGGGGGSGSGNDDDLKSIGLRSFIDQYGHEVRQHPSLLGTDVFECIWAALHQRVCDPSLV